MVGVSVTIRDYPMRFQAEPARRLSYDDGRMNNLDQSSAPAAGLSVAQRWLPALLLLFIGSGCAALIYEVVWFQLLQLSIGSSAVSLGVLLGIFMGGMCLGSLLLPKYIKS